MLCAEPMFTLTVALAASDDHEGTSTAVSSGTIQGLGAMQRYQVIFSASVGTLIKLICSCSSSKDGISSQQIILSRVS